MIIATVIRAEEVKRSVITAEVDITLKKAIVATKNVIKNVFKVVKNILNKVYMFCDVAVVKTIKQITSVYFTTKAKVINLIVL